MPESCALRKRARNSGSGKLCATAGSAAGNSAASIRSTAHATPAAQKRDEERTRVLESLGFLVVRVSNVDIYDNLDGVLEMIDGTLRPP
jgi:hypothetical protein